MVETPDRKQLERALDALASFQSALGDLVINWNIVEASVRELLGCFASERPHSPPPGTDILTVELGTVGLGHALQSYANDLVQPPYDEFVLHAVEYFDRVRIYRNYYVHGIANVMSGNVAAPEPVEVIGQISYVTAKGQLAFHSDEVKISDLRRVTNWCRRLNGFLNLIRLTYFHGAEHFPSLDKPPLPEKLKKPRRSLQELRTPPAS